jgi:hypothetical protein
MDEATQRRLALVEASIAENEASVESWEGRIYNSKEQWDEIIRDAVDLVGEVVGE